MQPTIVTNLTLTNVTTVIYCSSREEVAIGVETDFSLARTTVRPERLRKRRRPPWPVKTVRSPDDGLEIVIGRSGSIRPGTSNAECHDHLLDRRDL